MKISIGVPVYGVEEYIERCAESLFAQTYNNLEFIFVNDCTKDRSIEILENVIKRFPYRKNQITIINHSQNKGLAAARNTALRYMTGDFLLWVDSDDYIDTDSVRLMVEAQKETGADIIAVNHYCVSEKGTAKADFISGTDKKKLLHSLIKGIGDKNTVWGRLIRRSIYVDNNIMTIEGNNMAEDLQVVPKLYYFATKIFHLDLPLYYYNCTNTSSYTSFFSEEKGKQSLKATEVLLDFFKEKDNYYIMDVYARRLKTLTGLLYACGRSSRSQDFFYFLKDEIQKIPKGVYNTIPFTKRIGYYIDNYFFFVKYVLILDFIRKIIES